MEKIGVREVALHSASGAQFEELHFLPEAKMSILPQISESVKLIGGVLGLLTTIVGVTVFLTKVRLEATRKFREAQETIARQQSTIKALESSCQALTQSVSLLREGKEEAATILMDVKRIMSEGRHLLMAAADSVLVPNPYAPNTLVFLVAHGTAAEQIKHLKVPIAGSAAGRVFLSGRAEAYSAQDSTSRYTAPDVKSDFRSNSILSIPLVASGRTVGVLQYVNRTDGSAFATQDAEIVRAHCDEIAFRVDRLLADTSALKLLGLIQRTDLREGSFLILDLTRSGTLFSRMPAGDVLSLFNEYYDRVLSASLRREVALDRMLGDGMLLRVNIPTPVANFAQVAVACALDVQAEFHALREEWIRIGRPADELKHRIGIGTGEAVGGMMGHPQFLSYTVIGDAVHRAARMCESARGTQSGIVACPLTIERLGPAAAGIASFTSLPDGVAGFQVERLGRRTVHASAGANT